MAKKSPAVQNRTTIKKAAFLAEFRQRGNITAACEAAEIGRQTYYDWLRDDPDYKARVDEATEEAADRLETEARRRAIEGVDEPVFGSGGSGVGSVQVGTVRRYSDTLLIFLMKGASPEKYRERYEHSGPGGGPITVKAEQLTDDELAAIAARGSARITAAPPSAE